MKGEVERERERGIDPAKEKGTYVFFVAAMKNDHPCCVLTQHKALPWWSGGSDFARGRGLNPWLGN